MQAISIYDSYPTFPSTTVTIYAHVSVLYVITGKWNTMQLYDLRKLMIYVDLPSYPRPNVL